MRSAGLVRDESAPTPDRAGNVPSAVAGTAWAHAKPEGSFRLRMPDERRAMLARGKRKNRFELDPARSRVCVALRLWHDVSNNDVHTQPA